MSAEAHVTPIWKKQRIFLFALMFFFSGYFLLDGAITYPRLNHQFRTHGEYMAESKKEGLSPEEKKAASDQGRAQWEAHAKREGWDLTPPESIHNETVQFIFAGLTGILGVIALLYWWSHKDRVLRTTETEVFTPNGKRVPFKAITGLGKKKWDSKGLATVRYELEGHRGQFIIDDYKFEPKPTRQILSEIEQYLTTRSTPQ